MGGCSALGCTNNSTKGFRLFRVPSIPERRKLWMEKCHRYDIAVNAKLCEIHFTNDQFESHRADGWRKLKPNAVPTLYLDSYIPKRTHKKPESDTVEVDAKTLRNNIYIYEDVLSKHTTELEEDESEALFSISRVSMVENFVVKNKNDVNTNTELSKKFYIHNVSKYDDVVIPNKQDYSEDSSNITSKDMPTLRISAIKSDINSDSEKEKNIKNFPTFNVSMIDNIIIPKEIESSLKSYNKRGISIIPVTNIEKVMSNSKPPEKTLPPESSFISVPSGTSDLEILEKLITEEADYSSTDFSDEEKTPQSELENEVARLKQKLNDVYFALRKFLNDEQMHALMNPSENPRWTHKSFCKGRRFIRFVGIKGYNFLRSTNYPLPPRELFMKSSNKIQTSSDA